MSAATDDVWRQLTTVEAFARVSLAVATAVGSDPVPHEAALADARDQMNTLKQGKVKAPTALGAVAAEALAGLRATYDAHVTSAEERLALPDAMKHVLRVDESAEAARIATARVWLDAIAAVEEEG